MTADNPTWILDEADERGVPTCAHCSVCGFGWVRPDDDPEADTVFTVALFHRGMHRP